MTAPHFKYNFTGPIWVSVGQPVTEFPLLTVFWLRKKNVCLKKQGMGVKRKPKKLEYLEYP